MENYEAVENILMQRNRKNNLLLGNGFSINWNLRFKYQSILNKAELIAPGQNLWEVFRKLKTQDFEKVKKFLDQTIPLEEVLSVYDSSHKQIVERMKEDSRLVVDLFKQSLIQIHPADASALEPTHRSCYQFLKLFDEIFTLNYDLLLYWVLNKNKFGNGLYKDGFSKENKHLVWGPNSEDQNVFYLHGALHYFQFDITRLIKERWEPPINIVDKVVSNIDSGLSPLIVYEGVSKKKLESINRNPYLAKCFSKISKMQGNLVIFGFSFSDADKHIIYEINRARLDNIYVSVFEGEDGVVPYVKKVRDCLGSRVVFFDSAAANIWR